MCVAPGSTIGAWISSLTTRAPYLSARSRIVSSSARVCTCPHGLCGLVSSSVRAPSAKSRSRCSRSSTYASPSGVTGQVPLHPPGDLGQPELRVVRRQRQHHRRLVLAQHVERQPDAGRHVDGRDHLHRVDRLAEVALREPGVRLTQLAAAQLERRVAQLAAVERVPHRLHDRLGHRVVHLRDPRRDDALGGHAPLQRRGRAELVVGEIADHAVSLPAATQVGGALLLVLGPEPTLTHRPPWARRGSGALLSVSGTRTNTGAPPTGSGGIDAGPLRPTILETR